MIIYSIYDLVSKSFDDEEIENVNKYLIYSLVIGMFKHAKINLDDKEILSLIKKDNWFDKYNWTKKQRDSYKKTLDKIFYNQEIVIRKHLIRYFIIYIDLVQ